MNGNNIVADTSLLVNFFNGIEPAKKILNEQHIWVSVITEIELLSYPLLTDKDDRIIRSFLDHCMVIELSEVIRELAIKTRKEFSLKVPDAIIAATSMHLDFPLITMDTDFKKIDSLNVVILELDA